MPWQACASVVARALWVEYDDGVSVPLSNLGSGEEQVIVILERILGTGCPIVQIEEPEAHLHTSLMEKLAGYLASAVRDDSPARPFDQLWLATHHHLFALAPEYLDVRREGGQTKVERLPRPKAAKHFYEPGPIWEAVRSLAESGMARDAVIFRDGDRPVRAKELLDDIEKEGQLSERYVRALTEQVVLSMKSRANRER